MKWVTFDESGRVVVSMGLRGDPIRDVSSTDRTTGQVRKDGGSASEVDGSDLSVGYP